MNDEFEGGRRAGLGNTDIPGDNPFGGISPRTRDGWGSSEDGIRGKVGKLEDKIVQAIDRATAAVVKAGDQARDAYARATENARRAANTVDPFVQDRPYTAIALGAAVGLLIGLLLARPGPKVIYVKPRA